MNKLALSERINKRVEESQKEYSPAAQKAELLLRNSSFMYHLSLIRGLWDLNFGHEDEPYLFSSDELFNAVRDQLIKKAKKGTFTKKDIRLLYEQFRLPYDLEKIDRRYLKTRRSVRGIMRYEMAKFASELKELKEITDEEIETWLRTLFPVKLPRLNESPNKPPRRDDTWWKMFCRDWRINIDWDGNLETLKDNVFFLPVVISRGPAPKQLEWWTAENHMEDKLGRMDPLAEDWTIAVEKERAFIYVRIEPWTDKKEILDLLPAIRKTQKQIFGYSKKEAHNFGRDLCWYDLHNAEVFGKKSYGEIAAHWNTWGGKGTFTRSTVQTAIHRIAHYIDRASSSR